MGESQDEPSGEDLPAEISALHRACSATNYEDAWDWTNWMSPAEVQLRTPVSADCDRE